MNKVVAGSYLISLFSFVKVFRDGTQNPMCPMSQLAVNENQQNRSTKPLP